MRTIFENKIIEKAKQKIQDYVRVEIELGSNETAKTYTDFLYYRKEDYYNEVGITYEMVYEWVSEIENQKA